MGCHHLQPQKYAIGYKNITANDNFFTGHFPERKIMPGTPPTGPYTCLLKALVPF